jgi:hypothetical protein
LSIIGLFYLNIEILSLINNTYSDKVVHHILNKVYVCIIYYKYTPRKIIVVLKNRFKKILFWRFTLHSIYSVVKYFNWINMADLTFFRNKKQFSWNDYVTSQYFSYIGEVSFMVGERLRELPSTKTGSYPHEFLCRTDCSACADYQPWGNDNLK